MFLAHGVMFFKQKLDVFQVDDKALFQGTVLFSHQTLVSFGKEFDECWCYGKKMAFGTRQFGVQILPQLFTAIWPL